ncbi:MAG: hypothetical protein K8953_03850, partial [Proteobacteria bacterium]|nr:hypothetical protein [Pseudomonadota bacterium]
MQKYISRAGCGFRSLKDATLLLFLFLTACGGGGGGGGGSTASVVDALGVPLLADLSAQVLTIGSEALSSFPNSGGGFLTSCRVSPDLPSGLSIERTADVSSC